MSDCDHTCRFDAEEVAYAIIHIQHLGKPLTDPERLSCGYCSRDHWYETEGEWRKAYDAQKKTRAEALS